MADTKILALGCELITLTAAEAHYFADPNKGESDHDEKRLNEWCSNVSNALVQEKSQTVEDIAVKLAAIVKFNTYGDLTWEEPFADGATSDALVWSVIRDLVENPSLLNRGNKA